MGLVDRKAHLQGMTCHVTVPEPRRVFRASVEPNLFSAVDSRQRVPLPPPPPLAWALWWPGGWPGRQDFVRGLRVLGRGAHGDTGWLFPGGHVQRMCRGRGLPPLSLLRVYSLSSLGLVRRWSWRGAVRQAGEPPGRSQGPPVSGRAPTVPPTLLWAGQSLWWLEGGQLPNSSISYPKCGQEDEGRQ